MRALRKLQPGEGHVELIEADRRVPGHGEVLLDILATGICGTDLHLVDGVHPAQTPVTLGHEFVGRIAETGPGAGAWQPGDRVVCEPHFRACRTCGLCRRGLAQHCKAKGAPGIVFDGALADHAAVPAWLLHRVPDSLDDVAAALCEPTAISVTAVERAGVEPGEDVVVLGPGAIGLLSAMVARAAGANSVVVAGRASSAARLAVAQELGFETWDSEGGDVLDRASALGRGLGADVVIDTTGSAVSLALRLARRRGRVCALGLHGPGGVEIPWDVAMFQAVDLSFSMSSSYTSWDRALTLLASGAVDAKPLITVFPLAEWDRAFTAVRSREAIKAVITP
ncbi:alcohol dehydrogenase catalytic domain-containing protein [Amycolatopsis sp. NPDC051372]|uniref:zinc-dependent alcohol dehydrogenase n=1 Tax=Amycolatopsis sp. NPDC051372 TaxID=3155669 RepID=UPI00343DDD92